MSNKKPKSSTTSPDEYIQKDKFEGLSDFVTIRVDRADPNLFKFYAAWGKQVIDEMTDEQKISALQSLASMFDEFATAIGFDLSLFTEDRVIH